MARPNPKEVFDDPDHIGEAELRLAAATATFQAFPAPQD